MPDDRPTSYLVIFTRWSQKSLISQAFPNYFLFRGIVTQGCLGSQRINAIVSSYLSLLDLQSSPTVLPLSLSHHVDPNSSPSKVILPHFFYFWICWFLLGQQGPGVDRRNQNTKYVEPMPFHKIPFGGDVESCTRVHNAFATKELQQYRYYTTQLFIGQPGPSYHQFLRNWKLLLLFILMVVEPHYTVTNNHSQHGKCDQPHVNCIL